MPQILKRRCNFSLRWLLDLGSTSLQQSLRLKTLDYLLFIPAIFLICCLAVPWLTFRYYWGNSLTRPMLTIASGLSIFSLKVTRRGSDSTPNWVPSGLWSQWDNPVTHSPQIAENSLPRLVPSFYKMWKCFQYTQNSYSLTL